MNILNIIFVIEAFERHTVDPRANTGQINPYVTSGEAARVQLSLPEGIIDQAKEQIECAIIRTIQRGHLDIPGKSTLYCLVVRPEPAFCFNAPSLLQVVNKLRAVFGKG